MQLFSCLEGYSTLDGIFELAHIARPVIAAQRFERLCVYSQNALPCRRRVLLEEMIDQERNVFPALA